jgi:hypothetical protein
MNRLLPSPIKLVAAGFTPAFKHHQRILLAVLERGHEARGYEKVVTDLICREKSRKRRFVSGSL